MYSISRPLKEAPYTKEYRVKFWCKTEALSSIQKFLSPHNPKIPVYCDTKKEKSYWTYVCALTQYQYRLLDDEDINVIIPNVFITEFLGVVICKRR